MFLRALYLLRHMTQKNILRAIKNPVVEKLARDNDWHVYKIIQMNWNTKIVSLENMKVTNGRLI